MIATSNGSSPADLDATVQPSGLALSSSILDRFRSELRRIGLVGEDKLASIVFLAATSRLLDKVVSVAVKGPSAGGKSYTVEATLRFFPDDAYHALTAMSERALAYSEVPLAHRMLVIYEAVGMESEWASYMVRSLLSEGRLRYETVEKSKNGMKARVIEREGPTGLIVTTTKVRLHPENETRLLSMTVKDTAEQTRAVLRSIAQEDEPEIDLAPWHELQRSLEAKPVTIPFAGHLAEMIPPKAVRLRRDFSSVLGLIRAHALLHQATRDVDRRGRIVAKLDDYAEVRNLVHDLVASGVGASVSSEVRETVAVVEEISDGEGVTQKALVSALNLDKSAVSRRVRSATRDGYLRDLEERRGHPSRLVVGDSLPEDAAILPTVEELRGCTVDRGVTA